MLSKGAQRPVAQVVVPQSKNDPSDVKVEEIALPPQEMWRDLDNSGAGEKATTAGAGDAPAPAPPAEIAELDFIGDAHLRVVPLKHAFRLDGRAVTEVTIRRLKIGELGDIIASKRAAPLSLFDVYAHMAGLPAAVLRGLVDEDGDAVTDAAYDFLPRALRTEAE